MFVIIKNFLIRIKGHNDARVLLKNFGYLSILQVAGYIFPLLTLPYLARTLGVEGFGKIAFSSAVIVWFQTISDWGFSYTATRDLAQNRNDIDKVSEIFSNVFWARIFLLLVSFCLLVIGICFVPLFKENYVILLISFLLIPGYIMFPEWFFQAMERMRYITILSILSKSVFTALVFLMIKDKSDYILQPLFISLGYLLSGFIAMFFILVKWKIKIGRPRWDSILLTIRGSKDVFINNIVPNFYNSFSILLLGSFSGSIANGKLDAGNKFVTIAQQFMSVLSKAFFPFLSRRLDSHNIYLRLNLYLSFFLSLILIVFAPILVRLFFTKDFYEAIPVLQIMSVSLIFNSLSNVYGTNYLIIKGYERELRNITAICALIGFLLSFPLIYYFSFIGAALSITLTRILLGLSIMMRARSINKK